MHRIIALSALLATAFASSLAAAAASDTVLGSSGEIYRSQVGPCRDLNVACPSGSLGNPSLAIDVVQPDFGTLRSPVPGTDGPELEGRPTLVFEDLTENLFVVWESRVRDEGSQILLAWLNVDGWSEVIEVSGNRASLNGPPQLAVTRDTFVFRTGATTSEESHERTFLHISWWEQGAEGEQLFYTPILLEDGRYIGANTVVNLTQLDPNAEPAVRSDLPGELFATPGVGPGRDSRSVVVGFTSPSSQRFLSFEMRLLPGEVTHLADELEEFLLAQDGAAHPDDLDGLARRARRFLVRSGSRLHPGLLTFAANQIREDIRTADPATGIISLAGRARAHFVEIGARLFTDHGLVGAENDDRVAMLFPILPEEAATSNGVSPATSLTDHMMHVRLIVDLPAPETGAGETWNLLSASGERAIIAWQEGGDLFYRENTETGWRPIHQLELKQLSLEEALKILRQRLGH